MGFDFQKDFRKCIHCWNIYY